ncbi:hypothetical protein N7476_000908 [Penicillium atrosanguineum]|uniref:Uncharacterized protein n=1 Tax=Penicillium atrosanguineum TaxID=1132637 RepID=A0A9W9QCH7_9EURO|nr:hypothetical protein N7526_000922 [Penicillium atrosanguineum]KAJ5331125.1 hypothetical protein N7476_000908 [Penicillium atrosanguineum]
MRVLPSGQRAQPSFFILFLLVLAIAVQVSAVPAADTTTDAQTTADPSTTDSTPSVTESTTSTESTSTTTSDKTTSTTTSSTTSSTSTSTTSTTTMSTTTTSDTSTSTSSDTTTSSVSTTTTSTSSSSSSTSTGGAVVTIPPTANAPYMQTSNTPEGTVFIAVGAILGFIGLAVLAWRGMVAWSVNRSVRRAALAHSSENKRLMRGSRKKRGTTVYTAAPAGDVSLEKLGTRAGVKPNRRVPSSNSGLFFSPTAGGAGSHNSLSATGNRGSTYLPSGYYVAAGSSTPVRNASGSHVDLSSPSLPNVGAYDPPHNQRSSYVGGSTSSLNLNQTQQGRAPSAYLEDLFENHPPPSNSDRRHHR